MSAAYRTLIIFLVISLNGKAIAESTSTSKNKIIVKHYQKQIRYEFGLQLLQLALSKLNTPFELQSEPSQDFNEARGERMVIEGQLDLEFLTTTTEREEKMIPIKIPIYRGLLGLRLLLVTHENKTRLSGMKSLTDLQQFIGGHGRHWGDLPIYANNQLRVVTNVVYEGLFKQLIANRFDYFHRGLNEIWDEVARYPDSLVILDDVMLFYPQPVYFFVSKHNPQLAQQLEKGLNIALTDGSYESLFLKRHRQFIDQAKLSNRTMIILKNPNLPQGTPNLDTDWWLPKTFQQQLLIANSN